MISRIRTLLIAGLAVTTLASPIRSLAQEVKKEPHHYRLIDLGTFGGPESSFKVSPQSPTFARVLNNQGAVAGNADTSMPDPFLNFCFGDCFVSHAFEWENGVKTDLRALHGGASSASNWISANGLIAGLSENGKTDPLFFGFPELRAVLWHNGTITDLGTLPEGGFESGANAVNSRGQVVGFAMNTIPDSSSMQGPGFFPTQTRAFLWQNGAMQDLGTLGTGTDAQALFINEKGQVAGWSYINSTPNPACFSGFLATGSFIWDKENGLRDLGSLGGACTLVADLNEQGQIAGVSNLAGDQFGHAFLWNKGSIQDLGGALEGISRRPSQSTIQVRLLALRPCPGMPSSTLLFGSASAYSRTSEWCLATSAASLPQSTQEPRS